MKIVVNNEELELIIVAVRRQSSVHLTLSRALRNIGQPREAMLNQNLAVTYDDISERLTEELNR